MFSKISIMKFEMDNFYKEITKPPTYMKELGIDEQNIMLVHLMSDPIKEELVSPLKNISIAKENNDSLDLTGSPLEVDLKGDESVLTDTMQTINLWLHEEERHFPMEIREARQFINQQLESKNVSNTMYVICDGINSESTVILGANQTETIKVNILGYLSKDHKNFSLDKMEENHKMNVHMRRNCKISYHTKFRYYLYGSFLQKIHNIFDLDIYGSICIQASGNSRCAISDFQNSVNSKTLVLQLIVGHQLSSVNFLWNDLCIVKKICDILSDSDRYENPLTILSDDPLDMSLIYKEISSAVKSKFVKEDMRKSFSLQNIRMENILDKLWIILKRCENLHDLRESFHFLFEELTEVEISLKLPGKTNSNIAAIVAGIMNGSLAVPNVTYSQALEFLFELGSEKLKNDYQRIIKNFIPSSSDSDVCTEWSVFKNIPQNDRQRRTRITLNRKPDNIENNLASILTCLGKLHLIVEFIYLINKETNLPEDTFTDVCQEIYDMFIKKNLVSSVDFSNLHDPQIFEMEIPIKVSDMSSLRCGNIPASWLIKMKSRTDDMEVTTVYHVSLLPIFPPTIYNCYDTTMDKEDCVRFYVHTLERYKYLH